MKKSLLPILLVLFSIQIFAQNWGEIQKVSASDRAGYDYFGGAVAIDGNYAIVGAYLEEDSVTNENAGAAYIFEKDANGNWVEVEKLRASDYSMGDEFGNSVAVSGDYAVVGAHKEMHDLTGGNPTYVAGSAYIFKRDGSGNWNEVQKIVPSDRNWAAIFGCSVSISGNTIVVGAFGDSEDVTGLNYKYSAGAAFIFEKDGSGVWNETQKIVASDRDSYAYFGLSVSIDGDILLVGSPSNKYAVGSGDTLIDCGAAYFFEKGTSGTWVEAQKVCAADRAYDDSFAESVSLSNNYAIIGAQGQDEDATGGNFLNHSGAAYIFEKNGSGVWNQAKMMVASDRSLYGGSMGATVDIDSNVAIAGARYERNDANGTNDILSAGAAYIFIRDGSGNWQHANKIVASDRAQQDEFGYSVAIDGDNILVSAKLNCYDAAGNNFLGMAGSAYFFLPNNIGVAENAFESQLKVYPNPTSRKVTIDLGSAYSGVSISVVNLIGQTILTKKYENTQFLDVEINGATGVYFVKVNTKNGNKAVIKILKE